MEKKQYENYIKILKGELIPASIRACASRADSLGFQTSHRQQNQIPKIQE